MIVQRPFDDRSSTVKWKRNFIMTDTAVEVRRERIGYGTWSRTAVFSSRMLCLRLACLPTYMYMYMESRAGQSTCCRRLRAPCHYHRDCYGMTRVSMHAALARMYVAKCTF